MIIYFEGVLFNYLYNNYDALKQQSETIYHCFVSGVGFVRCGSERLSRRRTVPQNIFGRRNPIIQKTS